MQLQLSQIPIFLTVAFVILAGVSVNGDDSPYVPNNIEFKIDYRMGLGIPDHSGAGWIKPSVSSAIDGKKVACLRLCGVHYSTGFIDVHESDILPIVLGVYQVEQMTTGRVVANSSGRVRCRLLSALPDGVKTTPNAYAFPFHSLKSKHVYAHSTLHGVDFRGEFVPAKKGESISVHVRVQEPTDRKNEYGGPEIECVESELRVDDFLKIRNHSFKVVNIVPPDPESHVIGWFEINIEPEPDVRELNK